MTKWKESIEALQVEKKKLDFDLSCDRGELMKRKF